MHCFVDGQGRQWSLTIHVEALMQVRGRLNLDMYKLFDDDFKGLKALASDYCQLAEVLWVLCEEQAEPRGIVSKEFFRGLMGDGLEAASLAFVEEIADFCPNARLRAMLKEMITKGQQVQNQVLDHVENQLAALDPRQVAQQYIVQSGKRRDSSASIPVLSPTVSSS